MNNIIQFPDTLDKQIQREIADVHKTVDAEIASYGGLEAYGKHIMKTKWPLLYNLQGTTHETR